MLHVDSLTKKFGRLEVLNSIQLEFQKGTVTGILGPNGSGKTTLIKCLLGLCHFEKGNIALNAISIKSEKEYKSYFGYMPQIGRYPENMSIGDLFELLVSLRNQPENALDLELWELFKLENIKSQRLGKLSGGTVQKVSAALAYLFKPEVIVLDEPTAGLDPLATEIMKEKIRKESSGKITLITSHILNDLDELCSHIVFLNNHKIAFSKSMKELKASRQGLTLNQIVAQLLQGEA